jgi:hypothetical protein
LYHPKEGITGYQAASKGPAQREQKAKDLPSMWFELASTCKGIDRESYQHNHKGNADPLLSVHKVLCQNL